MDWDALVHGPIMATFGEPSRIQYSAGGAPAITVDGVFDDGAQPERLVADAGFNATGPMLGVRLAQFPPGFNPRNAKDDTFVVRGVTYVVSDGRPDGHGWAFFFGERAMIVEALARRTLRLAVLVVLQGLTGRKVESPGVRSTTPAEAVGGYLALRCGNDRKASAAPAMAMFNTTCTLEIVGRVSARTEAACQDALEQLGAEVEAAVFAAPAFIKWLKQIAAVTTTTEITGEREEFLGEFQMLLDCETYEEFDPTVINPDDYPVLQEMLIHLDLQAPYDANGTYQNPAFPDSVKPAPRTSGPDGRDEGFLQITNLDQ